MMKEYWKERLGSKLFRAYEIILFGIKKFQNKIIINHVSINQIMEVYEAVCNDHPELFYVPFTHKAYSQIISSEERVTLELEYIYDQKQSEEIQKDIDAYCNKVLKAIEGKSIFEKIERVAQYIACHTEYEIDNKFNQSIASVFALGKGQCSGISRTFQYILNLLDIPCILVAGKAIGDTDKRELHAWNIVEYHEKYYHFDITFFKGVNDFKGGELIKKYLWNSSSQLKDHFWDVKAYPSCEDPSIFKEYITREFPVYKDLYSLKKKLKEVLSNRKRRISFRLEITEDEKLLSRYIESSVLEVAKQLRIALRFFYKISDLFVIRFEYTS